MKYHNHIHVKGYLELDQTKYIVKTRNRESMDLEVAKLLSRVCAFYEEEGYAIMDCPFVPFHIKVHIARHVEL
jgi:hypothetical protein